MSLHPRKRSGCQEKSEPEEIMMNGKKFMITIASALLIAFLLWNTATTALNATKMEVAAAERKQICKDVDDIKRAIDQLRAMSEDIRDIKEMIRGREK